MPADLDDDVFAPRKRRPVKLLNVFQRDVQGPGRARRGPLRRATQEADLTENELVSLAWDRTITNADLTSVANRARAARAMWKALRGTAKHFGDSTRIAVASAKWADGMDLSGQFLDALAEVIDEETEEDAPEEDGESAGISDYFWSMFSAGEEAEQNEELEGPPLDPATLPEEEVEEESWWDWAVSPLTAVQKKAEEGKEYLTKKYDEGASFLRERAEALDEKIDKGFDTAKMVGFGMVALAAAVIVFSAGKKGR